MNTFSENLRQGAGHAWASVAQGWRELRARAGGALTRFRHEGAREDSSGAPGGPRGGGWGLMAADVLVDDEHVVVRIEAPGMSRDDLHIDVERDRLSVSGEKRIERESGDARYRVRECAYGSFRREVMLPLPVDAANAKASYKDGVLRVEMLRLAGGGGRRIEVRGD